MFFYFSGTYSVELQVQAADYARVRLVICMVGKKTKKLQVVTQNLKKDLMFTKQFDVVIDHVATLKQSSVVKGFFRKGVPLVIFLKDSKKHKSIEWRLYDSEQATMLAGKRYVKRGKSECEWAHHIADAAWPLLTGQEGFFSTKLAYCKEIRRPGKKPLKHIYIADYNGEREKLLVATSTVNIAPRWNKDSNNPLLFYSEHTSKNVRLVVVDMTGRRKIVSNFDGMNMLPAFSADGKKVVFCASRGGATCQLYYYEKGKCRALIKNSGNNISPTFSQDGEKLFFCSDFETKNPQLYCYEFGTEKIERLTNGGYCVSPAFCAKNNQLAYARMVCGVMQVFSCDLNTKKHKQVTFNAGNKEECSWSPCGNYLLFAIEKGAESRISILNLNSSQRQFITPKNMICCYPAWSCPYTNFAAAA